MPISRRACLEAAFLLFAVFLAAPAAHARSCRVQLVPNGSVASCATCHRSAVGGSRNPFGQAVEAIIRGSSSCNLTFWGPNLARADSDADGTTNGTELQDPDGAWTPGMPNPGETRLVTNPGVTNPKRFLRGDFNGDGRLNVTDAISTLTLLFAAGPPSPCRSAADANNDAKIDLADAILTLQFLFAQGPRPPAPFPSCGTAPARLGCTTAGNCP